jgi:hypothetical protein
VRLRVLVLTREIATFTGSEIVAWEVAEWFAKHGDEVVVGTPSFGAPLSTFDRDFAVTTVLGGLDLASFDLVWSQHHTHLRIQQGLEHCVRKLRLPLIVAASLSPWVAEEHVDGIIARATRAEVWANSDETAEFVSGVNRSFIRASAIHRFHNAAPASFWEPAPPPRNELRSLIVVSNHVPAEVREAITILRGGGLEVRVIGADDEPLRVDRDVLVGSDAVISIGKTVVDAIACGRPVYVYDHFGGDGWLSPANYAEGLRFNFSGRPHQRVLTAEALVEEVLAGYGAARAVAPGLAASAVGLRLDDHLGPLRIRAGRGGVRRRAVLTGTAFLSRRFKSHLATVRRLMGAPV